MEWVEGADLRQLLPRPGGRTSRGRKVLPWMRDEPVRAWWLPPTSASSTATSSMSNLLLDSLGRARVADSASRHGPVTFGRTPAPGRQRDGYAPVPGRRNRAASNLPERDIYSFGVTYYHVLTGRPPFEGETAFSVLYKHKMEPLTSPRAREPDAERTSEVLERCLAKRAPSRFSSFAAVLGGG